MKPLDVTENEPDREEFKHSGLTCVILRIEHSGVLCGYVGIPDAHILYGCHYGQRHLALQELHSKRMHRPLGDNPSVAVSLGVLVGNIKVTPEVVFEVHGGITYSRNCLVGYEEDDLWWFGFDANHCNDYAPKYHSMPSDCCVYRDIVYIRREVKSLAEQLSRVRGPVEITPPKVVEKK